MNGIKDIRNDFPLLNRPVNGKPLVYLDSAATSLKPSAVIERITRYYTEETANIHRGVHFLSEQATIAFENARNKVRSFIKARSRKEIIFTHGTTESINIIARSLAQNYLNKDDVILVTEMEHHSNFVPWQMIAQQTKATLEVIPVLENGELDLDSLQKKLTSKVKLLAITYVSNALGTINPIEAIIKQAHAVGSLVLVDAAQAIIDIPINVQELDCDFLVFSGHKMFASEGIGVLYGKESALNEMPPVCGGGDMILSVSLEKTIFNELPYKFEAGTPNIAGALSLDTAIDWITKIDFDWLTQHKKNLLNMATTLLSEVPDVHILARDVHKTGIISFTVKNVHPHDIGSLLDQDGIAVRTGHHCSQLVMKRFNIPATTRLSIAVYNTESDILQCVQRLHSIKELLS